MFGMGTGVSSAPKPPTRWWAVEIGAERRWASDSPTFFGIRFERPQTVVLRGPFRPMRTEVEEGGARALSVVGTVQLGVMVRLMGEEPVKPHGRLVRLGFTCCHASTYRLST